ncbi:hypothetical protein B0H21DRAFT_708144 [Amylocystis lapponica]|nr:hypothetical protein B0H21DRAFT_708144 [Amylocystis lapponica]
MRSPVVVFSIMAATVSPILRIAHPRFTEVQNKSTAPLNVRRQPSSDILEGLTGGGHHGHGGGLPVANLFKDTPENAAPNNHGNSDDFDAEDISDDPAAFTDDGPAADIPSPDHSSNGGNSNIEPVEPIAPPAPYAGSRSDAVTPSTLTSDGKKPGDASKKASKISV